MYLLWYGQITKLYPQNDILQEAEKPYRLCLSFNVSEFCINIICFYLQNFLCYRVSLHVKFCHKNFTWGAQEATLHIHLFLPPNCWTGAISLLPPLTQNPDFSQKYSVRFLCPNFLALSRQTSLMINNMQQNCNKNGTGRNQVVFVD